MATTRRIEFIYFDMGNVLLAFDHSRASLAIGKLVGVPADEVHREIFDSGLELRYERGELTSREFHAHCVQRFGESDYDQFLLAAGDIFDPIQGVHSIVGELSVAGRRLGLLSNTCEAHWLFCRQRFPAFQEFELFALSYELRSLKPEPIIYRQAAELASVAPSSIFFIDDRPENVEAACAAGYDAVEFRDAESLRADLTERGLLASDS